ncbi:cysteine--tRNA ligase [Pseudactinotalea sp. Z1739]|uniref:cysteine--tRNA ligase n=1 Tax=Pseudactinotalea sp. Z1739 TaxID=3413028 RepID=UPI003C7ED026
MSLHLYDSATREVRRFEPEVPGKVGIYLCGATVQGSPHIGHMRSAVAFDILTRWLRRSGYQVTLVRNVTDIDDKILSKSAEAGAPWWAWAYRYEREFTRAYDALGVAPPTYEPRATGHITEMVELIELLIERGHAYTGDPGNVYFDVHSFGSYGALTRQLVENMTTVEEAASDKRNPHDFALWKAHKEGEPATAAWPTPYGRGRPGWHLECSAMARKYLGTSFDIHGGGIDLRFPHHENEQAQSWAAGWGFARLWMHNAWVTTGGEKMSKSLGNSLLTEVVLQRTSPMVLRYALGAVHYRSALEFSDSTLSDAAAAWQRITGLLDRAGAAASAQAERISTATAQELDRVELPEAFSAAMDEDLNVSAALAAVHEHVRHGNSALAAGREAGEIALQVRAMLAVLGLDPYAEPWRGAAETGDDGTSAVLDALISQVLTARARARADKDWPRADELRDQLQAAGVVVEDSSGGARWSLRGDH